MKWIYIIILVGLVAAVFSSEKLRSIVFSDNTKTETTTSAEPTGGSGASRVGEMDAASEMSRNAAK